MYNLSNKQIDRSLIGLIYGDGNYRNGSVYIYHSNKQRSYISMLETWAKRNKIKHSVRYDFIRESNFGAREYSYIRLRVKNKKTFDNFNRLFNSEGKKILSDYLLKRISPIGLLFWYLDDGYLSVQLPNEKRTNSSRFARICTQGFDDVSQERAISVLKKRFDLDLRLQKVKHQKLIYIPGKEFRKFIDIVRPYIDYVPKDMKYKFNMKYSSSKHEDQGLLKYNF